MKIMFVCDTMGSGGAERVIATLSNGFVKNGHNVSILMISSDAKESFYKLDKEISLINLTNENLGFFKKAKLLKKTILSNKPDIVISFLSYVCIYTWWALRHTKIPYIVSERNDPNHREKLKQFLLNKSFKKAVGCVFQTEDALEWYKKIVKSKGVIIHNPVSLDYVSQNFSDIKKQILYVGRLNEQKNCSMLIDAFNIFVSKHNDYVLKMYGDGSLKEILMAKIKQMNLQEKVVILPSSKKWQKEERDSAIFVLPSKYEGMPNVLAEALCLGMPCVASDCPIGGPKELKKFFPDLLLASNYNDTGEFADLMKKAIDLPHRQSFIPQDLKADFIVQKWVSFIEQRLEL